MKVYEVGLNRKLFATLAAAQRFVLSLGTIKEVHVFTGDDTKFPFTGKKVYTKKKSVSVNDYTDYVFYDALTDRMSYTYFLFKNKCLDCNTTIYFEEDVPPVIIKEIDVIEY